MAKKKNHGTGIEWTHIPGYKGETWNPIVGCSKISPACEHCYAEARAVRLASIPKTSYYAETIKNGKWSGKMVFVEHLLDKPLHWKKPRVIFVGSMTDIFHESVPDESIDRIMAVAAAAPQHIFIFLTKRADRMHRYFAEWGKPYASSLDKVHFYGADELGSDMVKCASPALPAHLPLPLPNVWLGVTAENQDQVDARIPFLLQTPAAKRFISVEPMLEKVDIGMSIAECSCCGRWPSRWVRLRRPVVSDLPLIKPGGAVYADVGLYRAESNAHGALSVLTPRGKLGIKPSEFECLPKLDWVICGGESGGKARPMHPEWTRSLRDQCEIAQIPFFFKQWGEWFPRDQWECNPELILPDDDIAHVHNPGAGTYIFKDGADVYPMHRVGKNAAGDLLDGCLCKEFPAGGKS